MFVDFIPSFFLAFLIFLRCAGSILFHGAHHRFESVKETLSTSIRIVTAIMLAMAVYAGQSVTAFNPPASLGGLTAIALTETAIGVFGRWMLENFATFFTQAVMATDRRVKMRRRHSIIFLAFPSTWPWFQPAFASSRACWRWRCSNRFSHGPHRNGFSAMAMVADGPV